MDSNSLRDVLDAWAAQDGYSLTVRSVSPSDGGFRVLATVTDEEAGAEMSLDVTVEGAITVVDSDSYLEFQAPSGILFAGGRGCATDPSEVPGVPPAPDVAGELTSSEALTFAARYFVDRLSSRNAPCTDNGNLACAWAVNHVVTVALGTPIGPTEEMLSTRNMYPALQQLAERVPWNEATAGDIVISPTQGKNIGHVGIFIDDQRICSNSSGARMWKQNHTKSGWQAYYSTQKGLILAVFRM